MQLDGRPTKLTTLAQQHQVIWVATPLTPLHEIMTSTYLLKINQIFCIEPTCSPGEFNTYSVSPLQKPLNQHAFLVFLLLLFCLSVVETLPEQKYLNTTTGNHDISLKLLNQHAFLVYLVLLFCLSVVETLPEQKYLNTTTGNHDISLRN